MSSAQNTTRTSPGKICLAVAADNAQEAARVVEAASSMPDVVEVRLDAMSTPDVAGCCRLIDLPLLFTCRPDWEGGASSLSDAKRARLLEEAVTLGATYIDWELQADSGIRQDLLKHAEKNGARMICSNHHFQQTPKKEELEDILQQVMDSGAHIGKIVTMASTISDVLRVLALQEKVLERGFPLCAFCMGKPGAISRLATLFLGGYMSYAAPDSGSVTAPGQLSFSRLTQASQLLGEE
jgi:3-dehydroquinate dehydratase-1/3-dehydroquinate dehydratase/shikimate dehydrogenase